MAEATVQWGDRSWSFATGEVVWLRGPNGAGKTTLLRALAGLAVHAPVEARVAGQDPARLPARNVPRTLGWIPADARDGLVGLTVAGEARLRGRPAPALRGTQDVATLSLGEARRLLSAWVDAPLLILDEPLDGLDAAAADDALKRIAAHEGLVVMAGQDDRLRRVATREVDLAPAAVAQWPSFRRAPGPRLEAPATRLESPPVTLPEIRVSPGVYVLRGPNGCGKSTLLRRLAGLEHDEGVLLDGAAPGARVTWLPDRPDDVLGAPTVAEECPPHPLIPAELAHRHPLSLSRGEQQRVALAKVLHRPADVVLLDEPDGHLDAAGRATLATELAARAAAGTIIVVASHRDEWLHAGAEVIRW